MSKQSKHWRYQCVLCTEEFMTDEELNGHFFSAHRPEKPFSHPQPVTSKPHRGAKTSKNNIKDNVMDLKCGRRKCRGTGPEANNNGFLIFPELEPSVSDNIFCNVCKMVPPSVKQLGEHMTTSHISSHPWRCEHCFHAFRQQSQLEKHRAEMKHQYNTRNKIMMVGNKYQCNVCLKLYSSNTILRHRVRHQKKKLISCTFCSKEFLRKAAFQQHMKVHEKFESTEGKSNLVVGGKSNIAAGGKSNIAAGGKSNLATGGKSNIAVGGKSNLGVGGKSKQP